MTELTEAQANCLKLMKEHGKVRAFFDSVPGTIRPMPEWAKKGVSAPVPPRHILERLRDKGYVSRIPTVVEWNGSWHLYDLTGKGKNS